MHSVHGASAQQQSGCWATNVNNQSASFIHVEHGHFIVFALFQASQPDDLWLIGSGIIFLFHPGSLPKIARPVFEQWSHEEKNLPKKTRYWKLAFSDTWKSHRRKMFMPNIMALAGHLCIHMIIFSSNKMLIQTNVGLVGLKQQQALLQANSDHDSGNRAKTIQYIQTRMHAHACTHVKGFLNYYTDEIVLSICFNST